MISDILYKIINNSHNHLYSIVQEVEFYMGAISYVFELSVKWFTKLPLHQTIVEFTATLPRTATSTAAFLTGSSIFFFLFATVTVRRNFATNSRMHT